MVDVEDGISINVNIKGDGSPLLMLHGNPETHLMWHRVAPQLAEEYTVVLSDLRGYGDSSHPIGLPDHSNYSKRAMANDQVKVMQTLGFREFYLVGHDRGARVSHRMLMDHPDKVKKCIILDIVPTYDMYMKTDMAFAISHYHWFFLLQENELAERLLSGDPERFIRAMFGEYSDPEYSARVFPEEIKSEYVRKLSTLEGLRSICEDYRASATYDMKIDKDDREKLLDTPILVLWGQEGSLGKEFDVLPYWQARGTDVSGYAIPGCGHFIPEDAPEATLKAVYEFMQ
jgi:haloacetate dehalogenase